MRIQYALHLPIFVIHFFSQKHSQINPIVKKCHYSRQISILGHFILLSCLLFGMFIYILKPSLELRLFRIHSVCWGITIETVFSCNKSSQKAIAKCIKNSRSMNCSQFRTHNSGLILNFEWKRHNSASVVLQIHKKSRPLYDGLRFIPLWPYANY